MMNNKQTAIFYDKSTAANNGGAFATHKGITALYSRLSNEDGADGQSGSITNQMEILENYERILQYDDTKLLNKEPISCCFMPLPLSDT